MVAHKSGTSGMDNGLAPATNDIGLVTLPDGRELALAVFVTDARSDDATRDRVIGEIGRAIYDAALKAR
jgi:beta-lactamase class A